MKNWLWILFFSVFCLKAQAAEYCTFAKIYLTAAKSNPCFSQLITNTKNADDRKWLLKMQNTWNPPADLVVNFVPGGLEMYQGSKHIGGFQWVTIDPPILYWNGEFKVGEKTTETSMVKIIQNLLHSKTTATYIYQSVLPQANARDDADQNLESLATLYSLNKAQFHNPKNAEETMSRRDKFIKGLYMPPVVDLLHSLVTGLPVQCTKTGVEKLDFSAYKEWGFILNTNDRDETIINTKGNSKKFRIKYSSHIKNKSDLCILNASKEMDQRYCQPLWKEFFAKYPQAETILSKNKRPLKQVDCVELLDATNDHSLARACTKFWLVQNEQIKVSELPQPENREVRKSNLEYFLCEDDNCNKQKPMDRKTILETFKIVSDENLSLMDFATAGAHLLGDCCNSVKCRINAFRNYDIDLKSAPKTEK